MENRASIVNLHDASGEVRSIVDWSNLEDAGLVKFTQGEPVQDEKYDLPAFDEKRVTSVAGLGLCLVRMHEDQTWALAPAKHGINAWATAAAYVRLGYIPPLQLAEEFAGQPDLTPPEIERVVSAIREGIRSRRERLMSIERILSKSESYFRWS